MLHFINGNLFDRSHKVDAIINTVNCFGVMGKGIALEFKNRYPQNFDLYKQVCKNKELTPGKMLTVSNEDQSYPKYIINFPTKNHWRHPSKIEYIENGLTALIEDIKLYSIKSIAMPALGCGNGGLNWEEVKKVIIQALTPLEKVDFYIYEPTNIKSKKEKGKSNIRLTKQRKLLLLLINHLNSTQYKNTVTYLEVNYLAYIAQFSGAELKLQFELTGKGPLDFSVNKLMVLLASNDFIRTENNKENENLILINKKKFNSKNVLKDEELLVTYTKVIELINGFETKERLTALAITIWYFSKDEKLNKLFSNVQSWVNTHNKNISDSQIREAINRVETFTKPKSENLSFDI
ncbi:type II toxin-antitoxin system antitoxin DNA ADP-ribosyl glycohydrolase DarG [Peribacillus frigoritolerans]|uniref:type II toxin-antitoxin system antitoxin DNA ADP-ribosyl glycohydrolase DarG n=1 Tax=Peribacillus frigoritolerans TaxID=450367 RepID=UPI003D069FAC